MRAPRQLLQDVRASDPTGFARKTALRCAIGMTLSFVIGDVVIDDRPDTALFAAFGAFAVLVLVDFVGPPAVRRRAYLGLVLAGFLLIPLGTVCSHRPALAATVMAVVGFVVLFSGLVNGYLAAASTAVLLLFVLPVMVPAAAAEIPDRLLGWTIACAVGLIAIAVLWPERPHGRLRRTSAECCRALAAVIAPGPDRGPDERAALDAVFARIRQQFFGTAYRPTGATGAAAALGGLLEELGWTRAMSDGPVARAALAETGRPHDDALRGATADVLRASADRLVHAAESEPDVDRLEHARDLNFAGLIDLLLRDGATYDDDALWTTLRRTFELRILAYGASQIGAQTLLVTAPRAPWSREALSEDVQGTSQLLTAHATMRSVWLRNSLRAAAGLALAVLAGQLLGVQHAFWVVLGTVSVLRSSALNTGATAVQAMAGTVVGIVIGGGLVIAIGTHVGLLWAALPVAVFLASYAPRVVSFAAGQAAFSVVVLVLFNLLEPAGWRVGLVRVEDVGIGVGISILVGTLFWPRGARAVVRTSLGLAYAQAADYAATALEHRLTQDTPAPLDVERRLTVEATQRLDATVRQYLSERTVDEDFVHRLGSLTIGPTRLRVVGDVVADTSHGLPGGTPIPSAAAVLVDEAAHMRRWYTEFGDALVRHTDIRSAEAAPPDDHRPRLVAAVRTAVASGDRTVVARTLGVVFGGFHLEKLRAMEARLTRQLEATLPRPTAR